MLGFFATLDFFGTTVAVRFVHKFGSFSNYYVVASSTDYQDYFFLEI